MYENRNISLVLSGGGARGIAHIGAIEELEKHGFEITSIVGTSMGAVVGAAYALDKLPEFKEWMLTLDRFKVINLLDFSFSTQGLVKGDKVFNTMKSITKEANIEDLRIPFTCVAVDIIEREEIIFKKGNVYDALRATVSIPTVFTPIKDGSKLLVDGGVLNNLPVNHAIRSEGDMLVAVDVTAKAPVIDAFPTKKESEEEQSLYKKKMKEFQEQLQKILPTSKKESLSYFEVINKTIGLMISKIAQNTLEDYPPDMLINISKETCNIFDFYRAKELIEIGRIATRNTLDEAIRKFL